jgi:hypothetical protein
VHGLANAAYLEGFSFPALLRVAPYCVPGGIRLVSERATATVRQQVQWHALATFGATICRLLFLGVAVCCRIGLSIVPELVRTFALSCKPSRMEVTTASAIGSEASPLLLPATSIPTASTHAVGAQATTAMPTAAAAPAATALKRGPVREVNTRATIASQ